VRELRRPGTGTDPGGGTGLRTAVGHEFGRHDTALDRRRPRPGGQATIPAGTALPGENLSANETAALQRATDEGRLPWRLHPGRVADAYVRGWLAWENLGAWSGWDDATITMTNPHTADVTDRTDGRMITVRLRQPERQGARGIWVVAAGVYDG
jgi:hypothetical protein